jgi:hypothetical protein
MTKTSKIDSVSGTLKTFTIFKALLPTFVRTFFYLQAILELNIVEINILQFREIINSPCLAPQMK